MGQRFSGQRAWRRFRQVVSQPAPAAGADWSIIVPAGQLWHIVTISAQLVTSAVAANRDPELNVSLGGAVFLKVPSSAIIVANTTAQLSWWVGATRGSSGGGAEAPIPNLELQPGAVVSVVTAALDVGDQWAIPYVYAEITLLQSAPDNVDDQPVMAVEVVSLGAEQ